MIFHLMRSCLFRINICFAYVASAVLLSFLLVQSAPAQISGTGRIASGQVINRETAYLVDSGGSLTIGEVMHAPGFVTHHNGHLNFGYFGRQVWLRFSLTAHFPQEMILEFSPYYTDSIKLYQVRNNRIISESDYTGIAITKTGNMRYLEGNRYLFPITADSGMQHIYLKIYSDYAVVRAYLKLWDKHVFEQRKPLIIETETFRHILAGFIFFASFTGLLLFLLTRQWIFLVYSLFTFTNIVHIFAVKGWLTPFLHYLDFFRYDIRGLFNAVLLIVSTWFFYLLVPGKYASRFFRKCLLILLLLIISVLCIAVLFPPSDALFRFFVFTFKPLMLITIVVILLHFYLSARNGYRLSWIFLLSLMPITGISVYHFFQVMNWVEIIYPNYSWEFAILFELLVYTVMMAYQYRRIVQSKIRAETMLEKNKQQYLQNLYSIQEQERIRIARDLHDSIGQKLSVVKMLLSSIQYDINDHNWENLEKTTKLLDEAVGEVRVISHDLMPEELSFGLIKAIEETAARINEGSAITGIRLSCDGHAREIIVPKSTEISVFRMVQEILHNMLKHAGAAQIDIRIATDNNILRITIHDNGKGFDVRDIHSSGGIGWQNIFARARFLNAELQIQSAAGTGTTVKLGIPVAQP